MANRSYLYSIDFDLSRQERSDSDKILSIAEWNYNIPIAFKLLLSVRPRKCPSLLWNYKHPIALVGDYEQGKERLYDFLDDLAKQDMYDHKYLQDCIKLTEDFLEREDRRQQYFFMECGEIFDMSSIPLEDQNEVLWQQISNIDDEIKKFYSEISEINKKILDKEDELDSAKNKNVLLRIFTGKEDIPALERELRNLNRDKYSALGIDNWSEVLYFDFETRKNQD
ncbi:hypothetical protein [Dysgonomonas sp. BGC7]|uniref:DUF7822 domain-containing protein n=1 Tax=Dysgonomonas sp. BGC7 TaxID=1658008 RepID=UPI0006807583|nr:hypothetical protein [Dysgonomonas sp. BGC7]MBD8389686.1 hypothetical protein [Dysgonomonas sp. BGC7]